MVVGVKEVPAPHLRSNLKLQETFGDQSLKSAEAECSDTKATLKLYKRIPDQMKIRLSDKIRIAQP